MRQNIQSNDITDPSRLISRMINDYVAGNLGPAPLLLRATVVAIDQVGAQFEVEPPNPKNTIKARILTQFYDANTAVEDLPVFCPMFPHLQLPIKEGEHVYVIFEDEAKTHGLWLTRIAEHLAVDSKNYTAGAAAYLANDNDISDISVDRILAGLASDPPSVAVSNEVVTEDVPEFTARIGDYVIHGSNNTMIVLGRDRPTNKASGESGQGTGTIDIVVGRASGSQDMDTQNDKSRVYISRKTNVDANFGTTSIGSSPTAEAPAPGPAIAFISDEIRIVARNGLKISVPNGNMTIDGQNINIGTSATEHAVLGDQLKTLLGNFITAVQNLVVNTAVGPSVPPNVVLPGIPDSTGSPLSLTGLTTQLNNILSTAIKVKSS